MYGGSQHVRDRARLRYPVPNVFQLYHWVCAVRCFQTDQLLKDYPSDSYAGPKFEKGHPHCTAITLFRPPPRLHTYQDMRLKFRDMIGRFVFSFSGSFLMGPHD